MNREILCEWAYLNNVSNDKIVRLWNPVVTSKPTAILVGHKAGINDVKVHADRRLVFSYDKVWHEILAWTYTKSLPPKIIFRKRCWKFGSWTAPTACRPWTSIFPVSRCWVKPSSSGSLPFTPRQPTPPWWSPPAANTWPELTSWIWSTITRHRKLQR